LVGDSAVRFRPEKVRVPAEPIDIALASLGLGVWP
jgi:hypothetical protein